MKTKLLILALCAIATAAPAQTFVEGKNSAGSTRTQNPVIIGGEDSDGKARVLKLNANGTLDIAITGGLTDSELRAAAVAVSVASLPLPAGASTAGNQATLNSTASSIDAKTPALGQATMANSQPVVMASNQTAIPVTAPATSSYATAVTTLQNAAVATGNGTALDTTGLTTVALQISGTFSATITFEATIDGSNWLLVTGVETASNAGFGFNSATAVTNSNQSWKIPVSGYKQFRARISTYASGSVTVVAVGIADGGPIFPVPGAGSATLGDGTTNLYGFPMNSSGTVGSGTGAVLYAFNGSNYDRLRVPVVTKTATATTSGDTALWAPTSGKKFRLMRYQIQVSGDASQSSAGVIDIVLRDSTTGLAAARSVYVPGAAGTVFQPDNPAWIDLGNGILSAATNNVLNINLSATLATGKVRVVCVGTEE